MTKFNTVTLFHQSDWSSVCPFPASQLVAQIGARFFGQGLQFPYLFGIQFLDVVPFAGIAAQVV